MRTLKKTLSLVLAVVMLLGIGVFSVSATNMKDDATIGSYYREAVEIVVAVDAMQGDENGNLNPQKELTRAEGAVLIARLSGVREEGGKTPFQDTDAVQSWAGDSINYCYAQGYIAGDGKGNFMPQQPLTGYAFEKMLLCALGYDAKIEKMVGAGDTWTVATATLAKKISLSWTALDPTKTLTREQAAKLVLNALKADKVDYLNRGLEVNTSDGTTVRQGSSPATAVTSKATMAKAIKNEYAADGYNVVQLGEELFNGDLKCVDENTTDDLGRPANKWTYKAAEITALSKDPVAEFSEKVGAGKVAGELSAYRVWNGYNADDLSNYKYANDNKLTDGWESTRIIGATYPDQKANVEALGVLTVPADTSIANQIAKYTANGRLVQVYANDDNVITKILLINYGVGKVTNVTTASSGNVTYTIQHLGSKIDYADVNSKDTIILANAIAKDDYVTWTLDKENVAYVFGTTKVDGKQSNYTTNNDDTLDYHGYKQYAEVQNSDGKTIDSVTVGGTKYPVGWGVEYAKTFTNNGDEEKSVFIDQYGMAVFCDTKGGEKKEYAVVNAIVLRLPTGLSTTYTLQAELAFADGTVKTVNVSKLTLDGVEYKQTTKAAEYYKSYEYLSEDGVGKLYDTASLNENSYGYQIVRYKTSGSDYELTYLSTEEPYYYHTGTTYQMKKGTSSISLIGGGSVSGNNATKYIVKYDTPNKFSAWTGFNSGKSYDSTTPMRVVYYNNNDGDQVIFLNAVAATETGSEKLFYATSESMTHTSSGGTDYYSLPGIYEGENNKTLTSKDRDYISGIKEKNLYIVEVDESGYVTKAVTRAPLQVASGNISDFVSSTDKVFFKYTTTAGTKVYVIDDKVATEADIDAIGNGDSYYVKTSASDENVAETIYILKDEKKAVNDYLSGTAFLEDGTTYELLIGVLDGYYYVPSNAKVTVKAPYFDEDALFVVESGATLTVELTDGATDLDSHFDILGGRVNVKAKDGSYLELGGDSFAVYGGGDLYIESAVTTVKTPIVAYGTYGNDTSLISMSSVTFSGSVYLEDGGLLGGAYITGGDTVLIAINGSLNVDGGILINSNEKARTYLADSEVLTINAGRIVVGGTVTPASEVTSCVIADANTIADLLKSLSSSELYGSSTILQYILGQTSSWEW